MSAEIYSNWKGKTCVIYIRVSSEWQVEGFSIDGQRRYLTQWVEAEGMTVAATYVEPGKSGKTITGREQFQKMLDDIATGNVITDYVLVFKLSIFSRNAKDLLNSLAFLRRYNVVLLSHEDGIDSGTATGRMMLTFLDAVAEMEQENIATQTMLGRVEKARQGGWNGGVAPSSYDLVEGKLIVNEAEAEIAKYCFETFVNTNIGYNNTLHSLLNRQGIPRDLTANEHIYWEVRHIRIMLRNPVYTGRIAYGRTRQQHIEGSEDAYRRVKRDDYIVSDEISHEAIISEELFQKTQMKLEDRRLSVAQRVGKPAKYILSSILKCPMCGGPMVSEYCYMD